MKRWIAVLAVCVAVVLVGSGAPPPCWGSSLVNFFDGNHDTFLRVEFSDDQVLCASWTQTMATTDTNIGAIVTASSDTTTLGNAWLTNAVGPSATASNVIASTTFVPPVYSDDQQKILDSASMTTNLFSGLSLAPGTYYLVLQRVSGTDTNDGWVGDFDGVSVFTAPGFSVGTFEFTDGDVASDPYKSNFALI